MSAASKYKSHFYRIASDDSSISQLLQRPITMCSVLSFFFDANAVGQSKAKFSMQALQEMNPDVSSDYLDESVETVLSNNPEFFNSFKVVIASALKEKTLLTLSRLLWSQNIPFVYCRSIGFIASARLQYKEHFVIEAHPDNKQSDLRLEEPFEALQKYLDVCHFETIAAFIH